MSAGLWQASRCYEIIFCCRLNVSCNIELSLDPTLKRRHGGFYEVFVTWHKRRIIQIQWNVTSFSFNCQSWIPIASSYSYTSVWANMNGSFYMHLAVILTRIIIIIQHLTRPVYQDILVVTHATRDEWWLISKTFQLLVLMNQSNHMNV